MADKKISEATPDAEMTGTEKIPLDDGGVAKFATTEQFKDFVLAKAASIERAGSVAVGTDGVYILKDGVLKPVDASTLATAVLDYGFGKAGVAAINGNEIVGVKDVNDLKTITVTALKTWLERNLSISAELDISSKPSAALPLENGNYLVIEQGSGSNRGNRRLTVANFADWVHNRFIAYVGQLTRVENLSGTDQLFIVRTAENTSLARVCTVSQLTAFLGAGDVKGPETTTENKIPQWDSAQKKLKDGVPVLSEITSENTGIPTAGAVRSYVSGQQSNNVVKTDNDQTITGTKTFSVSPVVPTPSQDMQASTKKYVDDRIPTDVVSLTGDQTIQGVKTFESSPVVPAPSSDMQAATKKYVDDAIADAESDNVKTTGNQSIGGVKSFSTPPTIPIPAQDMDAAPKKYVDDKFDSVPIPDDYVATSGNQQVGGVKTFTDSPVVPTVADVTDSSTKAASTEFVQRAIAEIPTPSTNLPRFPIVSKNFVEGQAKLDDCSINVMSIAVGETGTVVMPDKTEGFSRSFILVLNVTGTGAGTVTVNLSGGTFKAESATTFTITPGMSHVIGFTESGDENGKFLVSRRTFTNSGTAFTGTI